MITVLVVPVNEAPYLKEIPNTLEAMQKLVGGYIEVVTTDEGYNIVCDEEGKLKMELPNITIFGGLDFLAGTIFVCNNDEEGEFTSISKAQAKEFVYKYVIGMKCDPALNVKIKWNLEEWRKSL